VRNTTFEVGLLYPEKQSIYPVSKEAALFLCIFSKKVEK